MHPHLAPGFRFTLSGSTLTYTEFRSPTYLKYRHGGGDLHDMFSHGTVEVDAGTGRILTAELTADEPAAPVSVKMTVRYREDPQLKQLVPEQMTEEYLAARQTERGSSRRDVDLLGVQAFSGVDVRNHQVRGSEVRIRRVFTPDPDLRPPQ